MTTGRAEPFDPELDAALAGLPSLERSVVRLVYGDRRTHREAAALLSVQPKLVDAAMMRVYRAVSAALERPPLSVVAAV